MEQTIKFNEWMKNMCNLYYSDNEQMTKAFLKFTEHEKV